MKNSEHADNEFGYSSIQTSKTLISRVGKRVLGRMLASGRIVRQLRCHLLPCSSTCLPSRRFTTRSMVANDSFNAFLRSNPRLILGSSSPSRRMLMDELAVEYGFTYEVLTADIDERAIRVPNPLDLVLRLAHAKADAILDKIRRVDNDGVPTTKGFLLTCDQVVTHEGRILEKPTDAEEALKFISGYGRAPASTVGSTVCTDLQTGQRWEGVDVATIHFSAIPKETAESLVAEGEVMWCAGGLMVEHPLVQPYITRMDGGQDAVMGLCKARVVTLLSEAAGIAAARP